MLSQGFAGPPIKPDGLREPRFIRDGSSRKKNDEASNQGTERKTRIPISFSHTKNGLIAR
jgi:hypothetical protein